MTTGPLPPSFKPLLLFHINDLRQVTVRRLQAVGIADQLVLNRQDPVGDDLLIVGDQVKLNRFGRWPAGKLYLYLISSIGQIDLKNTVKLIRHKISIGRFGRRCVVLAVAI